MTRHDAAAEPTIVLRRDDRHLAGGRLVALDPRSDLVEVIATVLADNRRRAGLSQRQLAAAAGVGHSMIAAYETGRRHPTVTTLTRILTAGGVDVALAVTPAALDVAAGSPGPSSPPTPRTTVDAVRICCVTRKTFGAVTLTSDP